MRSRGRDDNIQTNAPGGPLAGFFSTVNADAMEFNILDLQAGDAEYIGSGGAFSSATGSQISEIGPLSISGKGSASASGNHGDMFEVATQGDTDSSGIYGGSFQAYAQSVLEIVFTIDEAAAFDLSGFLSAGTALAVGDPGNDVINRVSIILINTDTNDEAFQAEISDDSLVVDEMGVIGAGEYRFTVEAYAEVFGGQMHETNTLLGDSDSQNPQGYSTGALFKEVLLELSATDQPIPEPVTTSLVGLSLGALVLRTSRRRRA